jgi:hypothetical protein
LAERESIVLGVFHRTGKEPPPVSEVWRSSIGSGYNSPDRVIPDLGQLSDHGAPIWWPSSISHKDAWDVLQDDEFWSHLPNDAECIGPEVPVIIGALAESGVAMWLTREASTENIHDSTPGSSVKTFDVVPDGSVIEVAVFDPGLDDPLAVFVPFDVAYGTGGASRQSEAETEATVPGEQRHFGGMYIHVTFLSRSITKMTRTRGVIWCGPQKGFRPRGLCNPGPGEGPHIRDTYPSLLNLHREPD